MGDQPMNIKTLPGGDFIQGGIEDLSRGVESPEALLVAIGRPRLERLGLSIPRHSIPFPELKLYEILSHSNPDAAHARYNALIRRLVSFERAAECAN
jgi:hypothetical protein